ncbi:olfactory receptor 4A15-like [Tachyglossus aculeatus]|uniref:olfactory receptor 4A15-like n=1 Tax=Tachyglossus aculeatus TaxID=9261 RepID=UPI0018F704F9|nr:olfactory receptor 4A15-like [Tachyglossus aculeatus]
MISTDTEFMAIKNNVKEFLLLGLTQNLKGKKIIFAIFLVFYIAILLGRLLIITIKLSQTLGSPTYYFLTYLSFSDTCFSTTTAPRLIVDSLSDKKTIPFSNCMIQIFVFHLFTSLEILVLILMAYDRYKAICKPLFYAPIMNQRLCGVLMGLAWDTFFLDKSVSVFYTIITPLLNLMSYTLRNMEVNNAIKKKWNRKSTLTDKLKFFCAVVLSVDDGLN